MLTKIEPPALGMTKWEKPDASSAAGKERITEDKPHARFTRIWNNLDTPIARIAQIWNNLDTPSPVGRERESELPRRKPGGRRAGSSAAANEAMSDRARTWRSPGRLGKRPASEHTDSLERIALEATSGRKGRRPREFGRVVINPTIEHAQVGGDAMIKVEVIERGTFIFVMNEGRVLYGMRALQSRPQPSLAQALQRPAMLLGGDAEVTSFVGRDAELAILTSWHDSPDRVSVMLVHGGGGQGKTRLVRQFAGIIHERQEPPQVCEAVSLPEVAVHGQAGEGEDADTDHSAPVGLLLLVDEADVWPTGKLLMLLRDAAGSRPERVRVLLTARASGTWWSGVCAELHRSGIASNDLRLETLDTEATRELAAAAGRSLAKAQGLPPPPPLTQNVLDLLAGSPPLSVELMVLARMRADPGQLPMDLRSAVEIVLEKELRYWAALYGVDNSEPNRIKLSPDLMKRAVYIATLSGPLPADLALDVVRHARISGNADPQQVIDDHARCYPPSYLDTDRLVPLANCLAEEFLGMLVTDGQPETSLITPDAWADSAPFRILGLTPPSERKAEEDARQRAATAGIDVPPAEPKYTSAYTFRSELLDRTILRLVQAASTQPHLAERQLYPLARNYPEAVVMTTNSALAELLAMNPPPAPDVLETLEHASQRQQSRRTPQTSPADP